MESEMSFNIFSLASLASLNSVRDSNNAILVLKTDRVI